MLTSTNLFLSNQVPRTLLPTLLSTTLLLALNAEAVEVVAVVVAVEAVVAVVTLAPFQVSQIILLDW